MKRVLIVVVLLVLTVFAFAQEYTLRYSGDVEGSITIQKENGGRIVITSKLSKGITPVNNAICPLVPPGEEFDIGNAYLQSVIIDGNTRTITQSHGGWVKTVVDGNTTTWTTSDGYWEKNVVDGNMITVTRSDGSSYEISVEDYSADEPPSRITTAGAQTVVNGNTTTITLPYGGKIVATRQGNTITIHQVGVWYQ
jgi:hypothetical protein